MKAFAAPVIFWFLSLIAGVFNWLFNLHAGRTMSKEDFAALSVFVSFGYLLEVPANAFTTTVSRFTAYYRQKGAEQFYFFFRQYWWLSWALGLFFFFLFFLLKNILTSFFGISSSAVFLLFIPFSLLVFLLAFEFGLLLGQMAFVWVGVLSVIEAGSKLLFVIFSQSLNLPTLSSLSVTVLSLPVSALLAWFISVLVGRSFRPVSHNCLESFPEIRETFRFLGSSFFTSLGIVLVCSLDVLLVKHFFPAFEAGIYATLSLLGKVLYFGAGGLTALIVPITARDQAKQSLSRKPLWTILGIVALAGGFLVLAYLLFPAWVISFLLTDKGLVVQPFLAKYSLAIYFLTLSTCFTTYGLAKKNYFQANLITLAALVEAVLISLFHSSISQVVDILFWSMLGLFLAVIASEFTGFTTESLSNNFLSFLKLFTPNSQVVSKQEKIRILIFNWRDIKHEQAGGAEVYLYEIAKRLSKKEFEITIFSGSDGRSKPRETLEGIEFIRRGGFLTVYFWAAVYYLFRFRNKFDLIIDSENGIPFFSPLYVRRPVMLLVHHVHQDIFLKSLLPPFSWLAIFLESKLMPLIYRRIRIICVSDSTAEDLFKEVGLKADKIIMNGVDLNFFTPGPKSPFPLVSYLGRLKAYKSIEVLIDSFAKLVAEVPQSKLVIAGEGDHRKELENYVRVKKVPSVKFTGKVTEKEKVRLLSESWIVVNPSYKEGWGIVCLEANACGTPVLASRVEGLREVVFEGESGQLFDYGDRESLYRQMKEIIINGEERKRLSEGARQWSLRFSWEEQTVKLTSYIFEIIKPAKEAKWLKQALPSESRF